MPMSRNVLASILIIAALCGAPAVSAQEALPAEPPAVTAPEQHGVNEAIAAAIAEVGESLTAKVEEEVADAGKYVREVTLQLGVIIAVALAVALALGMIIGSVLSALILRGAIKRAVATGRAG